MRVWLVEYDSYGNHWVVGIYTTKAKAEAAMNSDPLSQRMREFILDQDGEV